MRKLLAGLFMVASAFCEKEKVRARFGSGHASLCHFFERCRLLAIAAAGA